MAAALLAAASPAAANAAAGFRDFSFPSAGVSGPTGEKPQSKLWYNDGIWWADMFDTASGKWTIHRLDSATQQWSSTGTVLDPRTQSWADTLWDGTKLYVASAGRNPASTSDKAQLWRYSYTAGTKSYQVDGGFPANISTGGMEAIVLDKDPSGVLWATWTQPIPAPAPPPGAPPTASTQSEVYVNKTTGPGADNSWGTPAALAVPNAATATVDPDDISSVVSLNGGIGVMWSNQLDGSMYFSQHASGGTATSGWSSAVAVTSGAKMADDHINLKSMQEANGQVFATVKTSVGDGPTADPAGGLLLLLKRDATTGTWSKTTISRVTDDQTRPIVMINPSEDKLYVFATTPTGGGTIISGVADTAIFYKVTSMSNPTFGTGQGTPFIQTVGDLKINNATSTKQTVTAASGVVILASDNVSHFYMHNVLGGTPTPDTTISSGPPTTTTSASATFAFTSTPAGAAFECSLDSASFTACTSPTSYTGLAAGSHTFAVRATSGAATDDTPATQTWTVQAAATPPVTNPGPVASRPGPGTVSGGTQTSGGTQQSGGSAKGQGPTVTNLVCPANRSAALRWVLPKKDRIVSIVVSVDGKRYAKLSGSKKSLTVRLGKEPGPLRIEIHGLTTSGKVYAAVRTVKGCGAPSKRALHLVRGVKKT